MRWMQLCKGMKMGRSEFLIEVYCDSIIGSRLESVFCPASARPKPLEIWPPAKWFQRLDDLPTTSSSRSI